MICDIVKTPHVSELRHIPHSCCARTQLQCNQTKCPVFRKLSTAKTELEVLFKTLQKYKPLVSFFAGNPFFTREHFASSFVAVSSRSFHINITKYHGVSLLKLEDDSSAVGKQLFFMAPFADLLNHHNSFPAMQSGYSVNDKAQVMEFFADQDYARGDQVQTLRTSRRILDQTERK